MALKKTKVPTCSFCCTADIHIARGRGVVFVTVRLERSRTAQRIFAISCPAQLRKCRMFGIQVGYVCTCFFPLGTVTAEPRIHPPKFPLHLAGGQRLLRSISVACRCSLANAVQPEDAPFRRMSDVTSSSSQGRLKNKKLSTSSES